MWCIFMYWNRLADQVILSLIMSESQEAAPVAFDTALQCNVKQFINLYVLGFLDI